MAVPMTGSRVPALPSSPVSGSAVTVDAAIGSSAEGRGPGSLLCSAFSNVCAIRNHDYRSDPLTVTATLTSCCKTARRDALTMAPVCQWMQQPSRQLSSFEGCQSWFQRRGADTAAALPARHALTRRRTDRAARLSGVSALYMCGICVHSCIR